MSHSLDFGKRRLRSLVNSAPEVFPRLPLVHSTDSYKFEDALADGTIHPQQCNVFSGESLTYFFYGRPAFRPNLDAEPAGLKHYFPVCMLFKPSFSMKLKRAFPFDSGGFHAGFYGSYLHERMKLGDFGLEPDLTSPGKVVSLFFGSNAAYIVGKPGVQPDIDPSEFEAHSYLALINAKDSNAIDSRGSGIELQIAESISIMDAVAAVILPSTFADGTTGDKLKSLGVDPLPYRVFERSRPGEYTSQISEICVNYYIRLGLVDEKDL